MPIVTFPRFLVALALAYCIASFVHFSHNAEYIAFYPGMPGWLTREHVYLIWLAITGLGAAAWLLATRFKRPAAALALLGVYGAFGLDGLAHYTLALCSEYSLMANISIWSEAVTGLVLLLVSAVLLVRRLTPMRQPRVG
ncbi:hypothetical protein [Pelomonas sp. SE-A7]|uniref:hypothetical protein n=1 Tax=Pelomonas sp. SE-A7 TaxID=3054953 RepID=UPI00259D076D|nr:hypothetical protein [Pelomonas sp. SE-A7]MDM4766564.1 hypothetical protein [Pelomonas sp. SE-A7]